MQRPTSPSRRAAPQRWIEWDRSESTSPRKTRAEQLAEIGAPTMSSTRIAKVTADRAFAEGASLAPQWLAERRDFTEAWEHDTFLEAGMKKIPRERNAVDIDLVVEWLESHSELGVVLNCSGTKHRRLFFQSLARKAHLRRLAPSEVLFSCGDESGDEFFVVHHGALRILDEEGVEIAVVKRGEVLGYAALMQMSQAKNRVQRWTVACGAEERASLFALNATVFYEEMDTWGERIRAVARELHAKVDIFKPIGLLDLGRVACFMMKPADFACGDVIASQGAAARDLFIVLAGEVRIDAAFTIEDTMAWPTTLRDSHTHIIKPMCSSTMRRCGPGSVLGIESLRRLRGERVYACNAIADSEGVTVLRVSGVIASYVVNGAAAELVRTKDAAFTARRVQRIAECRASDEFRRSERAKRIRKHATKKAYADALSTEYAARRGNSK